MSDLLIAISEHYNVEGTPDTWQTLQIKNNQDFPFKVKQKRDKFVLSKGFSPRVNFPIRYNKVAEFDNLDDAYRRIIKRHNKSCEHMVSWTKIEV